MAPRAEHNPEDGPTPKQLLAVQIGINGIFFFKKWSCRDKEVGLYLEGIVGRSWSKCDQNTLYKILNY